MKETKSFDISSFLYYYFLYFSAKKFPAVGNYRGRIVWDLYQLPIPTQYLSFLTVTYSMYRVCTDCDTVLKYESIHLLVDGLPLG